MKQVKGLIFGVAMVLVLAGGVAVQAQTQTQEPQPASADIISVQADAGWHGRHGGYGRHRGGRGAGCEYGGDHVGAGMHGGNRPDADQRQALVTNDEVLAQREQLLATTSYEACREQQTAFYNTLFERAKAQGRQMYHVPLGNMCERLSGSGYFERTAGAAQ